MLNYLVTIIKPMRSHLLAACLFAGCFLVSCARPQQHPPGGYTYPEAIRETDTDYYFLPIGASDWRGGEVIASAALRPYLSWGDPDECFIMLFSILPTDICPLN